MDMTTPNRLACILGLAVLPFGMTGCTDPTAGYFSEVNRSGLQDSPASSNNESEKPAPAEGGKIPGDDGGPIGGNPIGSDPVDGDPIAGDLPSGDDPVGGDPIGGDPIGGDPIGGDPIGGDPIGGDPIGGDPVGGQPVEERFSFRSGVVKTVERYVDVDLLWVIDNSGSMAEYQEKLANGFKAFAETYFTGDRNIRLGTIPTDLWVTGTSSASKSKYGPNNGMCYGRLLPGVHDGTRPSVMELNSSCEPVSALPSNRTGRPILQTINEDGSRADLSRLIQDFQINARVGTSGSGNERGLESFVKFIETNETCNGCRTGAKPTALFKPNKLRGLIFLSDEHSQDILTSATGETVNNSREKLATRTDDQVREAAKQGARIFKEHVDRFFKNLDGETVSDPKYFVVSVANITCKSSCGYSKGSRNQDERWGPEYTAVADLLKEDEKNSAGKYSMSVNINNADYGTFLSQIGKVIDTELERVDVVSFVLSKAPLYPDSVSVVIIAGDERFPIAAKDIKVVGQTLEVNLSGLPANLPESVEMLVSYEAR